MAFSPYDNNLNLARLIDLENVKNKLDSLKSEFVDDGDYEAIRQRTLVILKQVLGSSRKLAENMLFDDGKGDLCAQRLSAVQDQLIHLIHDFVIGNAPIADRFKQDRQIAIVAVGGYGRGLLAPGSDIDLLFLLPEKSDGRDEKLVEYILYMLWDMGFKVGHATRSVDECISQAKADMTIRTSLVEARLILGDAALFKLLEKRFYKEVTRNTATQFIAAKLQERDQRHIKSGESRYLVEPNIKEGKGGLRDLHTLFWIGKYVYQVKRGRQLIAKGVYSRSEHNQFMKANEFLWTVRCHLHFLTGSAEERLSFDLQTEMARRLGYTSHGGLRDVERFMKHYFLVAKDVGNLTRIFCAALENADNKAVHGRSLIGRFMHKKPKPIGKMGIFVNENGRVNIAKDDVFKNTCNMMRLFAVVDKKALDYHPDALKSLSRHLRYFDKQARRDPETNKIFIDILTKGRDPETTLRYMNESGFLGRFMPQFGKIVSMMQFNMYHSYTVDEHLVRTVGVLADIENGKISDDHPLVSELIHNIPARDVLYVTLLLHDIAKGRPEDHSIAGGKVARKLCPRIGFSTAQSELCAWLIEEHLTMSTFAQSRDLSDPRTISDFAKIVQTRDRLKLLVILTVCDIRAVGPNVWNGWKGQLLRTLYYETELYLAGGFSKDQQQGRVERIRGELVEKLSEEMERETAEHYASLHYGPFLQTNSIDDLAMQTHMLVHADKEQKLFYSAINCREFEAITQITILAPDHPRLLSVIAQGCAAAGGNIVDAKVYTTRDGRALNSIFVSREFTDNDAEMRRAQRIVKLIENTLGGERELPALIARQKSQPTRRKAFSLKPSVLVANDLSDRFTVIEVEGLDRVGLLAELTSKLSDLNLNIASARVSTFGEKVIDTFYVTDLTGQRIEMPQKRGKIRKSLENLWHNPKSVQGANNSKDESLSTLGRAV